MAEDDLISIRWERLRWDLVNAMVARVKNHSHDVVGLCEGSECCGELRQLVPAMGMSFQDGADAGHVVYEPRFKSHVTGRMRDGMTIISQYMQSSDLDPLEGFMEVPKEIGNIVHSTYFSGFGEAGEPNVRDEPADVVRDLLGALVRLSFPDEFLEIVHRATQDQDDDSVKLSGGKDEQSVFEELASSLEANGYTVPFVTRSMVDILQPSSCGYTSGLWSSITPYDLDFEGHDLDPPLSTSARGLHYFASHAPSVPESFDYAERSNGYGIGMCFIVRFGTLFLSQQTWDSGHERWNVCTAAFNRHIGSRFEGSPDEDPTRTMVVFSDFRMRAYIISDIQDSWDEYAPISAVHAPLPPGCGIVGVWLGHDDQRYRPRSFDEVIEANWSPSLTASARYLRDCLSVVSKG